MSYRESAGRRFCGLWKSEEKKMKLLRSIITVTAAAALACGVFTGCADKNSPAHSIENPLPTDSIGGALEVADQISEAEDIGSFVITLYPEYAPISCEHFEKLVSEGYYDGLYFHRVIDEFMAQGGAPTEDKQIPENITGEFAQNGWTQNTLPHKRGTVSMARGDDMNSASGQFFIVYGEKYEAALDGRYAAFGEVTEGMEVVDKFLTVERSENARGEKATPNVPITIKKAEMIEDDAEGRHRARFDMTIG